MSSHTPGPWEVQWEYCECEPPCGCDNPYPYKLRARGRRVSPYKNNPEWQEAQEIADFMEVNEPIPIEEARANAYLIAATPDLLEALQNFVDSVTFIDPSVYPQSLEQARAAIAKAKVVRDE